MRPPPPLARFILSIFFFDWFFFYMQNKSFFIFYLLLLHFDPPPPLARFILNIFFCEWFFFIFVICISFCQVTMKPFSFMIHLIVHKVESIISKKALIFTRWNVRCIRNKAICGSKSANQTRAEFIIKISVSRKTWVNKWISVESTWISLKISQNNARLQLIWSSSL